MSNINMVCNFLIILMVVVAQTGYAQFDKEEENVECKARLYDDSKLCHENRIKFYLRNTKVPNYELLKTSEVNTIKDAPFVENQPIKFIIHGHGQNPNDLTMTPLPSEYIMLNYNVILIEYTELSKDPCYRTAIRNSKRIAKCSTELLEQIVQDKEDIELNRFHIIGLSLGGQIAGQMSHFLKEGKFSEITGIDPANEGFFDRLEEDDYVLTKDDADHVVVIHTNAGLIGKFPPMGHADFYANSGIFQPQCPIGLYLCSHFRSLILFLESIGDENMKVSGSQCVNLEDWFFEKCNKLTEPIPFGEQASKKKVMGIFFFETKDTYPYLRAHGDKNYHIYEIYRFHLDPAGYVPPSSSSTQATPKR